MGGHIQLNSVHNKSHQHCDKTSRGMFMVLDAHPDPISLSLSIAQADKDLLLDVKCMEKKYLQQL